MQPLKTYKSLRSLFFLKRKEARSVLSRFGREESRLRECERNLGILDAKGGGRGLSRNDIFLYRSYQDQATYYRVRMGALASTLSSYGTAFYELLEQLDHYTTFEDRLTLLSARYQELPGNKWNNASLHELVARYKAEGASLDGGRGPVLACLLAMSGQLISEPNHARQAIQFHAPILQIAPALRLISSR